MAFDGTHIWVATRATTHVTRSAPGNGSFVENRSWRRVRLRLPVALAAVPSLTAPAGVRWHNYAAVTYRG
jgi:hypothetical protein